jgi:hypothetical protein
MLSNVARPCEPRYDGVFGSILKTSRLGVVALMKPLIALAFL